MAVEAAIPDRADWIVPRFAEQALSPKHHRHALVVPVINEGERIREQLRRTAAANLPVDVVVADGGSSDGSLDLPFLRDNRVRALLTKQGPGRLSAQLRIAYAWCLDQGYAGIVTVDGNGKDNVEAVSDFVTKLDQGYDYVQGSRYRPGGRAENTPIERALANRLLHAPLMSLAGRRWFTDTTNGFRAYSRRYLLDPRVQPFREVFSNYELLFYLTVRAGQLGYETAELPVRRSYPAEGPVPTKIGGVGPKIDILIQLLRASTGRYAPRSSPARGDSNG